MRTGDRWPLAWLGSVVLAGCASTSDAGSGDHRIRGRVVGPGGMPLDGVRITTTPATDAVLTFDGVYEITRIVKTKSPISPGVYTLLPYKLGWSVPADAPAHRVDYPGGDFDAPDIELEPIVGPSMEDVSAPVDRTTPPDSQGSGVIRAGE